MLEGYYLFPCRKRIYSCKVLAVNPLQHSFKWFVFVICIIGESAIEILIIEIVQNFELDWVLLLTEYESVF